VNLGSATRTVMVADGLAADDLAIGAAIGGAAGLTKAGAGTLRLSGNNTYAGNTSVQSGALIFAGASAWAPALNGPGFTDITGGKLVLNYANSPNPSQMVRLLLKSSFAGNFAAGQLRSTGADNRRGLGFVDDGLSNVTIAYTWFGDANLDGVVNSSDFTALSQNFNSAGGVWGMGDFNYDQLVNALDFNAIAENYGAPPISGSPLGTLVPEPTTLALFAACSLALNRKRQRRFTQTPPSHAHRRAARAD
jgi:autotransporter-associated beta strand protein